MRPVLVAALANRYEVAVRVLLWSSHAKTIGNVEVAFVLLVFTLILGGESFDPTLLVIPTANMTDLAVWKGTADNFDGTRLVLHWAP
jgi:hypothetical protein